MSDSHAPSSAVGLVLAHAWLVLGVFLFGWDPLTLAVFYWYETVVIGLFALGKIALGGALPDTTSERLLWALGRLVVTAGYAIAIFCMCAIPGIFVIAMWSAGHRDAYPVEQLEAPGAFVTPLGDGWSGIATVGMFFAVHAYAFAVDYVAKRKYKNLNIQRDLKYLPARVGALFIIIFGGILWLGFGGGMRYVVIVFVLAKLYADLAIHRRWK